VAARGNRRERLGWIFELNGIFIVMRTILGGKAGYIRVFHSCWTHLSCERPSPFAQIDQGEHREGAIGVLGQATIANLGKAPDALEGQERSSTLERTLDLRRLVSLSASVNGLLR
jgi:hypothetical protein